MHMFTFLSIHTQLLPSVQEKTEEKRKDPWFCHSRKMAVQNKGGFVAERSQLGRTSLMPTRLPTSLPGCLHTSVPLINTQTPSFSLTHTA